MSTLLSARKWRLTVALASALILVSMSLVALWILGGDMVLAATAHAARVAFVLALVASAVMLICRWFALDQSGSAWLAAMLITLSIYLWPELSRTGMNGNHTPLVVAPDLVVMAVILWMLGSCARAVPATGWRHPFALGIGGGVLLSGLRIGWFALELPSSASAITVAITAIYPVAAFVCARRLLRTDEFPLEYRWHLVVPLSFGVAFYHFLPLHVRTHETLVLIATVVFATAAIDLFVTTALLVQQAFSEQSQSLAALAALAATAEEIAHHDEEVRHECRATMAGISTASHLLTDAPDRLDEEQSALLRTMLASEITRLQHLLDTPTDTSAPLPSEELSWDQVIEPLVLSLRTQGLDIHWERTGFRVRARPDTLSTAVHVLLCNTQRHAPGARVKIWGEVDHDQVLVHIADDGPGVSAEVSDRLFSRRGCGSDSPGEGLGLFTARRALRELGGDLRLENPARGAEFTMILPK